MHESSFVAMREVEEEGENEDKEGSGDNEGQEKIRERKGDANYWEGSGVNGRQ